MRYSLGRQLSIAFGMLVLLLSSALSLGLSESYARVATSDRGDALYTLANNTATMLADGLFERMREVQQLAAAPPRDAQGELDVDAWTKMLARVQETRPQYSWIGLAGPAGKILTATGGLLVGKDVSERPWFGAAQGSAYTGDVHAAKLLAGLLPPSISGEPLRFLDFAAPIHNARGELQAVLGVHATWDWAHDVANSLRSARDSEKGVMVFILDRTGAPIHRPLGVPADERPKDSKAIPRAGGADLEWSDGQHYLTAAATLPARNKTTDMQWRVLTRQPIETVIAATHAARMRFLSLGVLAGLFAIAQAFLMARRFTRPLSEIARAARRIEAGDLATEIPKLATSKEITLLSSALSAMKASLLEREAALAKINSELEERVIRRTSELRIANQRLTTLVERDALTGLYNRRAADERMTLELARHRQQGKPLGVLMIDVDHFKSINDTLGHQAGDQVLQRLAAALLELSRETDFVARLGGEEFLMLLPETPPEGAQIVAEKIRNGVAADTTGPKRITISIGLTCPAEQLSDEPTILRATDEALYAAKQAGRNRVERSPSATPKQRAG